METWYRLTYVGARTGQRYHKFIQPKHFIQTESVETAMDSLSESTLLVSVVLFDPEKV